MWQTVYMLFGIVWLVTIVTTQNVPPIPCPAYFEYRTWNNQYIAKITLPNVSMGITKVDVKLSQRQPVQANYYGRLSLFEDQDTTIRNLQSGQPVTYRVEFPTPNVLPKLARIAINDVDICVGSEYPPPSVMLNLQHSLSTSTVPLSYTNPGNSIQQPLPQATRPPFVAPTVARRTQPVQQTRPSSSRNNNCGREGSTGVTPFIYGGSLLTRGQFPWLTAIYQKTSGMLTFICGGSLISSRTIITAAHCFRYSSTLTAERILVYLGRHNLENYIETGAEPYEIQTLLINPEYSRNTYPDADVAILQTQKSVEFTTYIQPICLWSESADVSLIVGQTATVAGWGADESGRAVSPVPKMVDASIVSESDCLRKVDAFKDLASPRTLCAGNRDGSGPCMGDSGGGLMINRNGRWVLRGIVSAGQTTERQCNLKEFVIYCDLAKHITWVRSNTLA